MMRCYGEPSFTQVELSPAPEDASEDAELFTGQPELLSSAQELYARLCKRGGGNVKKCDVIDAQGGDFQLFEKADGDGDEELSRGEWLGYVKDMHRKKGDKKGNKWLKNVLHTMNQNLNALEALREVDAEHTGLHAGLAPGTSADKAPAVDNPTSVAADASPPLSTDPSTPVPADASPPLSTDPSARCPAAEASSTSGCSVRKARWAKVKARIQPAAVVPCAGTTAACLWATAASYDAAAAQSELEEDQQDLEEERADVKVPGPQGGVCIEAPRQEMESGSKNNDSRH